MFWYYYIYIFLIIGIETNTQFIHIKQVGNGKRNRKRSGKRRI